MNLSLDLGAVAAAEQLQMVCLQFTLWEVLGVFLHRFVCSEQKSRVELNRLITCVSIPRTVSLS